jgi:hypothetical protein
MTDIITTLICLGACVGLPLLTIALIVSISAYNKKEKTTQPAEKFETEIDADRLAWLKVQHRRGITTIDQLIKQLEDAAAKVEKHHVAPQPAVQASPRLTMKDIQAAEHTPEPAPITHTPKAPEAKTTTKTEAPNLLLANTLLYLGAGIFLFAVFVLVSFNWDIFGGGFKSLLLLLTFIGFYLGGLYMTGKDQFRRAGITFTIIGLITMLFTGLGLWNFGLKDSLAITGMKFEHYWLVFTLLTHPVVYLAYRVIKGANFFRIYLFFVYVLNLSVAAAISEDMRFRAVVFALLNLAVYTVGKLLSGRDEIVARASTTINEILDPIIFIVALNALSGELDIFARFMLTVSLLVPSIFNLVVLQFTKDKQSTIANLIWSKLIIALPFKLMLLTSAWEMSDEASILLLLVYVLLSNQFVTRFIQQNYVRGLQFLTANFVRVLSAIWVLSRFAERGGSPDLWLQIICIFLLAEIGLHWLAARKSLLTNISLFWVAGLSSMIGYSVYSRTDDILEMLIPLAVLIAVLGYRLAAGRSEVQLRSASLWLVAGTSLVMIPFLYLITQPEKALIYALYFSLLLLVRPLFHWRDGALSLLARIGEIGAVLGQIAAFSFVAKFDGDYGNFTLFILVVVYWLLVQFNVVTPPQKQVREIYLPTMGFVLTTLVALATSRSLEGLIVGLGITLALNMITMISKRSGLLGGVNFVLATTLINLILFHYNLHFDYYIVINILFVAAGFIIAKLATSQAKSEYRAGLHHSIFLASTVYQIMTIFVFTVPVIASTNPAVLLAGILLVIGLFTFDDDRFKDWALSGIVIALWGLLASVMKVNVFEDALGNLYFAVPALYILAVAVANYVRKTHNWAKILEFSAFWLWAIASLMETLWLGPTDKLIVGFAVIVVSILFGARSAISGKLVSSLFRSAVAVLVLQLLILFYGVLLAIPWWIYLGGLGLTILIVAIVLVQRASRKS